MGLPYVLSVGFKTMRSALGKPGLETRKVI
jgi:hypothetical protein